MGTRRGTIRNAAMTVALAMMVLGGCGKTSGDTAKRAGVGQKKDPIYGVPVRQQSEQLPSVSTEPKGNTGSPDQLRKAASEEERQLASRRQEIDRMIEDNRKKLEAERKQMQADMTKKDEELKRLQESQARDAEYAKREAALAKERADLDHTKQLHEKDAAMEALKQKHEAEKRLLVWQNLQLMNCLQQMSTKADSDIAELRKLIDDEKIAKPEPAAPEKPVDRLADIEQRINQIEGKLNPPQAAEVDEPMYDATEPDNAYSDESDEGVIDSSAGTDLDPRPATNDEEWMKGLPTAPPVEPAAVKDEEWMEGLPAMPPVDADDPRLAINEWDNGGSGK